MHITEVGTLYPEMSALHRAASLGLSSVCDDLINKCGMDVNERCSQLTPLQLACDCGHTECVRVLLTQPNIDINSSLSNPITSAMVLAIRTKKSNVVKLLLSHSKLDLRLVYNVDILTAAVETGNEILQLLLTTYNSNFKHSNLLTEDVFVSQADTPCFTTGQYRGSSIPLVSLGISEYLIYKSSV